MGNAPAPVATDALRNAVQNGGQAPAGAQDKVDTAMALLGRMEPEILKALPDIIDGKRFMRLTLTLIRQTPELLMCTPESMLGAILQAAQLGLEPGPLDHVYFIPRWNGRLRSKEVNFQIGYKGVIELAHRSPAIETIEACEVFREDGFTLRRGLRPVLDHEPNLEADRSFDNIVAVYGIARFTNGGVQFEVLPRSEIERHRQMSDQPDGVMWTQHYGTAARKTAIHVMDAFLPLAPDAREALAADNSIINANLAKPGATTLTVTRVERDGDAGERKAIDVKAVDDPGEERPEQRQQAPDPDVAPPSGTRRMNREEQMHLQQFANGDNQLAKDIVRIATAGRVTTTGRALSQQEILRVVGIVDLLSDEGSGYSLQYTVESDPFLSYSQGPAMGVSEIDEAIAGIPDDAPPAPPAADADEHPDPADDLAIPFDGEQDGDEQ